MKVSEKWGTDVDTAVQLALDELETTKDKVKITILEEPSKGFFGIGSKLALVRVEILENQDESLEKNKQYKGIDIIEKKSENDELIKKEVEDTCNSEENIITDTDSKTNIIETQDTKVKFENVHQEHEEVNMIERKDRAYAFLKELTENMGLKVTIKGNIKDNSLIMNITGKDAGSIIGKRGQTLDSIQYLTSMVANKNEKKYIRVVVDAEEYRNKRNKTLEKLAYRLGEKVIRTGKSVKLEPMNPYERKVIHASLQNNKKLNTRSEGQDPYRRVIIELK